MVAELTFERRLAPQSGRRSGGSAVHSVAGQAIEAIIGPGTVLASRRTATRVDGPRRSGPGSVAGVQFWPLSIERMTGWVRAAIGYEPIGLGSGPHLAPTPADGHVQVVSTADRGSNRGHRSLDLALAAFS